MAETKTRSSRATRSSSAKKRKATKAPGASPRNPSRNRNRGHNGSERSESARAAVEGKAKQAGNVVGEAGRSVGKAASKARVPLLAGGAAAVGAAGGLALGTRAARRTQLRRPKVKIDTRGLARAARDVGQLGMDVGQLASELRRNREAANGARRRSPVEVVLDGLTHRPRT